VTIICNLSDTKSVPIKTKSVISKSIFTEFNTYKVSFYRLDYNTLNALRHLKIRGTNIKIFSKFTCL